MFKKGEISDTLEYLSLFDLTYFVPQSGWIGYGLNG